MSDDEFITTEINNISLKKELNYEERIKIFEGVVNGYTTPEVHYVKLQFEKILEEYKEIKKLKKEIEDLKKENYTLREKTENINSGWIFKKEYAWRYNPITKEFEDYGFPLYFEEKKVRKPHYVDETRYMYHFKYYYTKKEFEEFDIPESLYEIIKKMNEEKMDISSIKTVDEMRDYIYSIGGVPRGEYFTRMADFILKRRGKIFDAEELKNECKFNNRKTRRDHCIKFIKWGLIKETKTSGKYKIIF